MAAPYVLARNLTEAHRFAQDVLGLARGYYRVVTSPSSIKGPRGADLHIAPGWEERFDRFAMRGALRWTRLTVVDHTKVQAEAPETRYANDERTHEIALRYNRLCEETDGLEPAGVQQTLTDATGFFPDLEAVLEPEGWEPPETLSAEQVLRLAAGESGADVAPAEEPKVDKRRRRRCKECGILVDPDEVESHAADHDADLVSLGSKPEDV